VRNYVPAKDLTSVGMTIARRLLEATMAIKPNGRICEIREQVIEDPVSGLTLQFVFVPESPAPARLRIHDNQSHGNREIIFDRTGAEVGASAK